MKAIVFDNAGTILKRVTALKNMTTKNIIYETNTIGLVNKNPNSLILVFQAPTKNLLELNCKIIDYLKNNKESFEIAYSRKQYTKDDVINALQEDKTTIKDIQDSAFALVNKYDIEICSGSAMIVNMEKNKIEYVYTAGGLFFEQTVNLFKKLHEIPISIYIASGDNRQSLLNIASKLEINQVNVYDTCNVKCKQKVVSTLQNNHDLVIMVGNNSNDSLALKQADIGILTIQQGEYVPENLLTSVDYVIKKISDVCKIIENEV